MTKCGWHGNRPGGLTVPAALCPSGGHYSHYKTRHTVTLAHSFTLWALEISLVISMYIQL